MIVNLVARNQHSENSIYDDSKLNRLRDLISELSFKEGDFTLSSGKKSNVFFNLKPTMLDPEGLNLLADLVIEKTNDVDAEFIGGMAMGAIPVLLAVSLKSHRTDRPLQGFWVRKEQKQHGMQQLIDGAIGPGCKVIIVDDVTTTGDSIFSAIRTAKEAGCEIACVLTVVDRGEGAQGALQKEGYELVSLFDRYDFTDKRPEDVA